MYSSYDFFINDKYKIKINEKTLERMKEKSEPYLLHIITKKGAGFEPAENERIKFHAISKIETNPSLKSPQQQTRRGCQLHAPQRWPPRPPAAARPW